MPGGEACVVLQSVMVRASRDTNFVIIKTKLQPLSDIFHTNTRHFYIHSRHYTPAQLPPRHTEPAEEKSGNNKNVWRAERAEQTQPVA